ncbi:MAG: hypothetical protein J7K26_03830 [Candidatus Aenigmarchaeota archaeon]|nr:hypothetical protein [Candidatus Aenigmarchaeota archaeon]
MTIRTIGNNICNGNKNNSMKQLDNQTVKKIKNMRNSGYSYFEISSKLKITKSTSYKYAKNVRLPVKSKKKISRKIYKRQKKFIENYAKTKKLPKNIKWNINKARIIGHCIFDGSVTDFNVNYTNSSKKIIDQFIKDIEIVYGLKYTNIYIKKGSVFDKYTVAYSSKKLCEDLKKYSKSYNSTSNMTKAPKKVFISDKKIIKEFIRTFWEDEGCITINGEILGRIKNKGLRDDLLILHRKVGIACSPYNCSDGAFGIRIIINKENLNKFKSVSFKEAMIVRGNNKGMLKKKLLERIYRHYLNGPVV